MLRELCTYLLNTITDFTKAVCCTLQKSLSFVFLTQFSGSVSFRASRIWGNYLYRSGKQLFKTMISTVL